jgi:hypothetical protein
MAALICSAQITFTSAAAAAAAVSMTDATVTSTLFTTIFLRNRLFR